MVLLIMISCQHVAHSTTRLFTTLKTEQKFSIIKETLIMHHLPKFSFIKDGKVRKIANMFV